MIIGFNQNSDEAPIDFTWNITDKSEMFMQYDVQLEFSRPLSVSAGSDPD